MSRRRLPVLLFAVAVTLTIAPPGGAAKGPKPTKPPFALVDVPYTDTDPYMEGAATEQDEWDLAAVMPDLFYWGPTSRAGFYYFENRAPWWAVSVGSGLGATYSGTTLFVAHDIIGSADVDNPLHHYRVQEDNDWNSFTFPLPGVGEVKIWVLANGDDPDDSDWLDGSEGLDRSSLIPEGTGNNLIDDRGFVARLNDDPSTDVHWFPGMAEPGDPGWVWADWHYVFGRSTFGQSFQTTGIDPDPENAVDHEVYEFCCHFGVDDPPWCLWWERIVVKIDDKLFVFWVLKGQFWLHFWLPPPGDPPGGPDPTGRFDRIVALLDDLWGTIKPAGYEWLDRAMIALMDVMDAFDTGSLKGIFATLKNWFKSLDRVRKADPAVGGEIAEIEMHSLALVGHTVTSDAVALDRQGFPADGKELSKVYRSLYTAGLALQKFFGAGGGKASALLGKYAKVAKAVEKAGSKPPVIVR